MGSGNECKRISKNCHSCHLVDNVCLACKNAWSLHAGTCVEQCPGTLPAAQHEVDSSGYSTLVSKGSGNFGRTCVASRNACGIADCHACITGEEEVVMTADGPQSQPSDKYTEHAQALHFASDDTAPICTICKSGTLLLSGRCVQSCPPSYAVAGAGAFGKKCVSPCSWSRQCHGTSCMVYTTTASRAAIWTGLESPLVMEACTRCRNAQYLLNGNECVSTCPAGMKGIGQGNFNRKCI